MNLQQELERLNTKIRNVENKYSKLCDAIVFRARKIAFDTIEVFIIRERTAFNKQVTNKMKVYTELDNLKKERRMLRKEIGNGKFQ